MRSKQSKAMPWISHPRAWKLLFFSSFTLPADDLAKSWNVQPEGKTGRGKSPSSLCSQQVSVLMHTWREADLPCSCLSLIFLAEKPDFCEVCSSVRAAAAASISISKVPPTLSVPGAFSRCRGAVFRLGNDAALLKGFYSSSSCYLHAEFLRY